MKKPLIGITKPKSQRINLAFLMLWAAIRLAGGRTKLISSADDVGDKTIHGLLLGGGTDVFPGLFFKEPKADYPYDKARDLMESMMLSKAEKEGFPTLAICRGSQLMNVYHGGSLHLDVSKVYEEARYPHHVLAYLLFRKDINIRKPSLLYDIVGSEKLSVNSIHRQSIDAVGKGLRVTSQEPNGVVQSIEKEGHPFYMGVQFHPERLIYRATYRRLFKAFIKAARDYAQDKTSK